MKEFKVASRIIFTVALLVVGSRISASQPDAQCDVDFQIVADRTTYSPGAIMHVKFLATNTGEQPLYFFRGISECSSQLGSFFLLVLDEKGHQANRSGCSIDFLMERMDVVGKLTAPESGIMLKAREIYGIEANVELPMKKGVYRLKAELVPAAFTSEQKETLSRKDLKVLQERCAAPVVTITVK
jgi:hypothetical protein